MERYQHGKIYKIVCNITDKVYIGSTCKKLLSQRLAGHVSRYNSFKKGTYHYVSSFDVLQENNYYIELLELVPCNLKDELLVKEKYYIKNNNCVNKHNPIMTKEEKKQQKNEIIICPKCNEEEKRDYMYRHK